MSPGHVAMLKCKGDEGLADPLQHFFQHTCFVSKLVPSHPLHTLIGSEMLWGAGSARTVNRRYIALFVAFKDRTWASALFVSLSAVGMALGPLLSLPLSLFPTRHFAGLTFDHVRP